MLKLNTMTDWPGSVSAMFSCCRQIMGLQANGSPNSATNTYPVIWDSGASMCMTFDRSDVVGDITPVNKRLSGIGSGLNITGTGTVCWAMRDDSGKLRLIQLEAYYVPDASVRLLSITKLARHYAGEVIVLQGHGLQLSGIKGDPQCGSITVPIDPANNLPTCQASDRDSLLMDPQTYVSIVNEVSETNLNLTAPEKELLRWHYHLGHFAMNKVQFILKTGVLSKGDSVRNLHSTACKLQTHPKCTACMYGKQVRRFPPGSTVQSVKEREGALKHGDLLPGQQISVDHFVTKTLGRLFEGYGKAPNGDMYKGGCIFVDHASGFIHIEFQSHLDSHETLKAKSSFEKVCMDAGVVPQSYLTDNRSAFTSQDFASHLSNFQQHSLRSAPGAHHHNGVAERNIRTIMTIARTMMIHASIHWPDVSDRSLSPMAVTHATFLFNHIPNTSIGHSPHDLFTTTCMFGAAQSTF
jgi:hypothetical protein